MRHGRIAAVVLVAALACACGKDRQEAAVALDEARLSVGGARKSGGESFAPKQMREADRQIESAEKDFKAGNYAKTQQSARQAMEAARLARNEASKLPRQSPRAKLRKTAKATEKKQ